MVNFLKLRKKSKTIWLLILGCVLLSLYISSQRLETSPLLAYRRDIDIYKYFDNFERRFDLQESLMPNKLTAFWTRDIQLCVMFNTVIDNEIIGLLLSYYLQFFNHITIISGTQYIAQPYFVPRSVQVLNCIESYYGRYKQSCIRKCLENPGNRNVKGFLYIADDMFINFTKMGNFDRTKLWTIPIQVENFTSLMEKGVFELHQIWWWFGFPKHVEYHLQKTIKSLPQNWMDALKTNAGFPDRYEIICTADIVYIPAHLGPRMIDVISFITNTTDLFDEVALPLVIGILTHPTDRELFEYGYLWGVERTLHKKELTAHAAHFVHPLKLTNSEDSELWKKLMKAQVTQTLIGT